MVGLISKRVMCMHGGLSTQLVSLDQLRSIPRPCEPPEKGLLIDLLWSDPTNVVSYLSGFFRLIALLFRATAGSPHRAASASPSARK